MVVRVTGEKQTCNSNATKLRVYDHDEVAWDAPV
jgi:hypothetical protein